MQADHELSLHLYGDDDKIDESAAKISFEFTEKLSVADDSRPEGVEHEEEESESDDDDDDDEEDYENEEEFSFASISDDVSPIAADKVFLDGQIRSVFPLFNQDLLLGYDEAVDRLPSRPPVDKVFIESPRTPSISSESEEIEGVAAGPYCTWTKGAAPEFNKKSNSTGFSKLWRFKEKISRSHSDGRDTFVFLNNSTMTSSSSSSSKREEKSAVKVDTSSVNKSSAGDGSSEKSTTGEVKVNKTGGKEKSKKGGKKKVTSLSPHEAYMRSKLTLTEDERRKSYLPYRPELMGFFTNVHGGGLTRNVHPF